jgi:hypothetical protein
LQNCCRNLQQVSHGKDIDKNNAEFAVFIIKIVNVINFWSRLCVKISKFALQKKTINNEKNFNSSHINIVRHQVAGSERRLGSHRMD